MPTSTFSCVLGSMKPLTADQTILKKLGALMMQVWPSISG